MKESYHLVFNVHSISLVESIKSKTLVKKGKAPVDVECPVKNTVSVDHLTYVLSKFSFFPLNFELTR